jgi:TolB protein
MKRILSVLLLLVNFSFGYSQIIAIDTSLNISKNPGDDVSPAWSPDSKKIVYQSDRNGNWDIFMYNLDMDSTIQLTFSLQNEQHPVWHPNGNVVVFDAGDDTMQYLYRIGLKTLKISPLFDRQIICKQPVMANDGRMVYFLGYDAQHENWELFSYHLIYDNLNQLTYLKEDGLFLDLSPDGKSVCYAYDAFMYPYQRFQIFNWYGNELQSFEDYNIRHATWHPDGLKMYFISDMDHLEGELYSIWKDGTHLIRLTDDNYKMNHLSISPDGKSLACSVLNNGNYEIMIIPLESF